MIIMKKILTIGAIMVTLIVVCLGIGMNACVEGLRPEPTTEANESVEVADKKATKKDTNKKSATTEEKATKASAPAKADKPAKTTEAESQTVANAPAKPASNTQPTTQAPAKPSKPAEPAKPSEPSKPTTEEHKHTWKTVTDKPAWTEPV